jgi:hypothetical protein
VEKIVIKPIVKEIVLRGKPEDGHVDVFSYNYEGNANSGLGSLFIVGQVNPGTEDTSYMINLVSSLAKREYYAKVDAPPKEAFSKTLKKINEVLQDFFRNKDLDVSIGIFTVTGDNILISRLGKFKIILSRDNQNIDVLNNINFFNKEHIQEKEFSNIISGKILPDDKLLAFYAGRSMTAREKTIKDALLKSSADEFIEKMNAIKKANESFTCASIHLVISKFKETAVLKTPQPRELRKVEQVPVLAKAPAKIPDIAIIPNEEAPAIKPIESRPAAVSKPKIETPAPYIKADEKSNVYYPNPSNPTVKETPADPGPIQSPEPNLIRPSEFSSAKKDNIISGMIKKLTPGGVYVIGGGRNVFSKKKLIVTGITLAVIVLAVVAKFTFAPYLPIPVPGATTPEEKAANELAAQAQVGLESAKTYIDQNNLLEARKILRSYMDALSKESEKTEQLNQVASDLILALDQIDKAVGSLPSFIQDSTQSVEDDFQAWSLVWSFSAGEIQAKKPELNSISYYPFQDNIYILAQDGIYKITDGLKGKTESVSWLNKDVSLPADPVSLTIDGKLYIIAESGILTTYYKGDKVAEVNTSIPVEKGSALLTTAESEYLYLVDKTLGRIYVLTKEAGSLIKTLKLNNQEPIAEASMGEDQTIYILSSDNKIWKVTP